MALTQAFLARGLLPLHQRAVAVEAIMLVPLKQKLVALVVGQEAGLAQHTALNLVAAEVLVKVMMVGIA
jgi:hypothetical protein